jgi:two-component system NtrC family sensor kinase
MGDHGSIRVHLSRRNGGANVEITDSGPGIPEANLLKIFDPFFTTKPVGEGTGMGLAIAHSIIDRHRGAITVKSKVGVGTTFAVWIPATP